MQTYCIAAKMHVHNDECFVCLECTESSTVPCGHTLCVACAMRWFQRSPTCPACRSVVVALEPPLAAEGTFTLTIRFNEGPPIEEEHVGITLCNSGLGSFGGVCVLAVHPRDLASRSGVRVGQVITHINGIPVSSHADAIRIVQCATTTRRSLVLKLRKRHTIPQIVSRYAFNITNHMSMY